jgi:hypothetical protein
MVAPEATSCAVCDRALATRAFNVQPVPAARAVAWRGVARTHVRGATSPPWLVVARSSCVRRPDRDTLTCADVSGAVLCLCVPVRARRPVVSGAAAATTGTTMGDR